MFLTVSMSLLLLLLIFAVCIFARSLLAFRVMAFVRYISTLANLFRECIFFVFFFVVSYECEPLTCTCNCHNQIEKRREHIEQHTLAHNMAVYVLRRKSMRSKESHVSTWNMVISFCMLIFFLYIFCHLRLKKKKMCAFRFEASILKQYWQYGLHVEIAIHWVCSFHRISYI